MDQHDVGLARGKRREAAPDAFLAGRAAGNRFDQLGQAETREIVEITVVWVDDGDHGRDAGMPTKSLK